LRRSMSWSFQCNHKTIWALSWLSKLQELKPGGQWVDYGSASVWSEEMLLKGLVLVFSWPFEAKWVSRQNRLTKSCGKSAQPLQSVRTKYLAVSPVTDNFEWHDCWNRSRISSCKFLKTKTCGLNWEYGWVSICST
jgi:hypothetical protein